MDNGVELQVRFHVDDAVLSALHDRAFGSTAGAVRPWRQQLERHSLSWVGAFDEDALIGFVQLAWDGDAHAFVIDTSVDPAHQRRGIGRALVAAAVAEATEAGCEWVHVDFDPPHTAFYRDACGFAPTDAGLIHLSPDARSR